MTSRVAWVRPGPVCGTSAAALPILPARGSQHRSTDRPKETWAIGELAASPQNPENPRSRAGRRPNAERYRGSRPETQATPRLERCLVAVLDEGEVGRRARKGHSSRGTPLSLGWRAVSLPQAPAAKSRLTGYCLCSACNDVLEPSGS